MTVKELIEHLSECDPGDIVIMSKDGEGNCYSPLSAINNTSVYVAEDTWWGEIGLRKLTDYHRDLGFAEEDVKDGEPCVVLWPTN